MHWLRVHTIWCCFQMFRNLSSQFLRIFTANLYRYFVNTSKEYILIKVALSRYILRMWFSWLTHFLHFKTKILCLGFIPNQCRNASISVFGEVQEWGEVHWLQQIHIQMGQFFSPVMQTQNFHMPSPKQGKVIWPICLIMESLIHVHLWKSIITQMNSESMLMGDRRTTWNFWCHVTVSWDSHGSLI